MKVNVRGFKMIARGTTLILIMALMFLQAANVLAGKATYEYHVVGNDGDVNTKTSAGLVLMGGSTDVDVAFQWMIDKSGGGDFVVIRATGTDAYNPYIYDLGTVDSVETLIIKDRTAASDPFVIEKIRNAEALFIAGGDQYNYVNFWKGTPVEDAIYYLVTRNVPIGGTSAGLAIMGEFLFSAENGTTYSDKALLNPYGKRIALDRDFLTLPNMNNIITDSHFAARDRMGRLITFLARIMQDDWSTDAKGIGIDEKTALLVDPKGAVTLVGDGAAYFLRTPGKSEICEDRTELTYHNIWVYRIDSNGTFQIPIWSGNGGTSYTLSAENGVLTSTQVGGAIY